MDKYELKNRKKQKAGTVELEFAFSYGLFGYGFSDQLENLVHSPEEVLRQSMFPRVRPPEDSKFSKWSLLNPQSVAHPSYIPFSETVTDLLPDLFADSDETHVVKIPRRRQSLKDSMLRLVKLRNEYLEQSGRTQRIKFLSNVIHAKESYKVEESSESSGEESGGYVPAGLAAMLSNVARATITQTVPGVTPRKRADYANLKVAVSFESMTDDNLSSTSKNELDVPSTSEDRATSQTILKHLATLQENFSPRMAQLADKIPAVRITTPSPPSSDNEDHNDENNDTSKPGNIGSYFNRIREKFRNLNQPSSNEEK